MVISTYYYRKNDNKQNTEEKHIVKPIRRIPHCSVQNLKNVVRFVLIHIDWFFIFILVHINLLLYTRTHTY